MDNALSRMESSVDLEKLATDAVQRAPHEAAELLAACKDEDVIAVLEMINPLVGQQILRELEDRRRSELLASAPVEKARQWMKNTEYPADSVGWLMEPPVAVFRPQMTVHETIEAMRKLTKRSFITYGYVTDAANKLLGVIVFRDLMLADAEKPLSEVMYDKLFSLRPEMELTEAMKSTLNRHFPVYPVCDSAGRLLGLVRGQSLFEARAIELSAQPGTMVGVDEEERLATPVHRSLFMRHPWLQINLVTAFFSGAVVACFQGTLDHIVILASFLPVLAGQSGNTGCQALAVCLRGLTLGDLRSGQERGLVIKEALLGLINGVLVGIVAALCMFAYAKLITTGRHNDQAFMLAVVVFISMTVSCAVSGIAGAGVPLLLRRFGFDPATASSIFLSTVTDCTSMGTFLALASWLVK
jgi:magnesium transporter